MVTEGTGVPGRSESGPAPQSPCNCERESWGQKGREWEREESQEARRGWERKTEKSSERWREWKFPSPNIVTPSLSLISN